MGGVYVNIYLFEIITIENLSTFENYNELTEEINNIYSTGYINPRARKPIESIKPIEPIEPIKDKTDDLYD